MSQNQSLVATQLRPVFMADSGGAVVCPAAGNTTVIEMTLAHVIQNLMVSIKVANHDIDAFVVSVQFHKDGPWVTLTSAVTSTPAGLVLAASGTLATTTAGSTAWLLLDVRGLYGVRISASGTVDDTTTVTAYAGGS